jgi:ACR3 family arsenite efflux pump ArsB
MSQSLVGGILIGIGIGLYIPSLPGFLAAFNLYLGLILIIIGLILLMRSKS